MTIHHHYYYFSPIMTTTTTTTATKDNQSHPQSNCTPNPHTPIDSRQHKAHKYSWHDSTNVHKRIVLHWHSHRIDLAGSFSYRQIPDNFRIKWPNRHFASKCRQLEFHRISDWGKSREWRPLPWDSRLDSRRSRGNLCWLCSRSVWWYYY